MKKKKKFNKKSTPALRPASSQLAITVDCRVVTRQPAGFPWCLPTGLGRASGRSRGLGPRLAACATLSSNDNRRRSAAAAAHIRDFCLFLLLP